MLLTIDKQGVKKVVKFVLKSVKDEVVDYVKDKLKKFIFEKILPVLVSWRFYFELWIYEHITINLVANKYLKKIRAFELRNFPKSSRTEFECNVDDEGNVIWTHTGGPTEEEMDAWVRGTPKRFAGEWIDIDKLMSNHPPMEQPFTS